MCIAIVKINHSAELKRFRFFPGLFPLFFHTFPEFQLNFVFGWKYFCSMMENIKQKKQKQKKREVLILPIRYHFYAYYID